MQFTIQFCLIKMPVTDLHIPKETNTLKTRPLGGGLDFPFRNFLDNSKTSTDIGAKHSEPFWHHFNTLYISCKEISLTFFL